MRLIKLDLDQIAYSVLYYFAKSNRGRITARPASCCDDFIATAFHEGVVVPHKHVQFDYDPGVQPTAAPGARAFD